MKKSLAIILVAILIGGIFYYQKYSTPDYEKWGVVPLPTLKPAWERKIDTDQELKIGIITDTQVHPSRVDKTDKTPGAPRYLKQRYRAPIDAFVGEMKTFSPDLIAVPGDIIEGTGDDNPVGMMGLQLVREAIEQVGVPIMWAIGNHELRSVTRDEYKQALNIDYVNGAQEFGDYKLITIDTNFYPDDSPVVEGGSRYIRGHASQESIDFLERELQTDKQTIVFMHHPPMVGEDGVPDKNPTHLMDNADKIQELLDRYNASVVFSGHIERKHHFTKNDVAYYAFPGTVKSKIFPGTFVHMKVVDGTPEVRMFYKDPQTGEYVSGLVEEIPQPNTYNTKKNKDEYEDKKEK